MKIYNSNSLEETQKIAEKFASSLKKGSVIALYGDLGSGKTTFVQGLAKGLGIKKRIISPTFIIVRSYKIKNRDVILASEASPESKNDPGQARMTDGSLSIFYHIDLYRLENKGQIEGLGIKELMSDSQNIIAIEWAEKIKQMLPKKRVDIYFEYLSENKRKIAITELSDAEINSA